MYKCSNLYLSKLPGRVCRRCRAGHGSASVPCRRWTASQWGTCWSRQPRVQRWTEWLRSAGDEPRTPTERWHYRRCRVHSEISETRWRRSEKWSTRDLSSVASTDPETSTPSSATQNAHSSHISSHSTTNIYLQQHLANDILLESAPTRSKRAARFSTSLRVIWLLRLLTLFRMHVYLPSAE